MQVAYNSHHFDGPVISIHSTYHDAERLINALPTTSEDPVIVMLRNKLATAISRLRDERAEWTEV